MAFSVMGASHKDVASGGDCGVDIRRTIGGLMHRAWAPFLRPNNIEDELISE